MLHWFISTCAYKLVHRCRYMYVFVQAQLWLYMYMYIGLNLYNDTCYLKALNLNSVARFYQAIKCICIFN